MRRDNEARPYGKGSGVRGTKEDIAARGSTTQSQILPEDSGHVRLQNLGPDAIRQLQVCKLVRRQLSPEEKADFLGWIEHRAPVAEHVFDVPANAKTLSREALSVERDAQR
jgi:hypothetical protein